jgi:hypothetical protein
MNILVVCGNRTPFYRNKPNMISRDQTCFSAAAVSTSDSGLEFTQNGGICMKYPGIFDYQISPFRAWTQNCEDRDTEVKVGREGKANTAEK